MSNLLESEWYKLRKNGIFRILSLLMVSMVIMYSLITYFSLSKDGGYPIPLTGTELYANAMTMNQFLLRIFLGVLAGFFIASEYSYGTLKRTVSAGKSRRQIFASKLAIFSLGVVVISLLIPIITIVIAILMSGLGFLSGFSQLNGISTMEYVFRTLGFTILFSAAFASIAVFIAVVLADNGKTIGVSIVFFLFIDQMLGSLGQYVPLLKSLYDYSLFNLYTKTIEYEMNSGDMILSILLPIVTYIVFTLLGISIFRRKEMK